MIDIAAVRQVHSKAILNTDPHGIHYSTYGKDYEGCAECEVPWPCEAIQYAEEAYRVELAILQIQRLTDISKIWGGMGWKFLTMPVFRVKQVDEICKKALEKEEVA